MTNLYKIPEIQWLEETTSDTHKSVNTIREYVIRPNSATNPESSKCHVVFYNGKPQTYWDTVAEAKTWVETVNYPSVVAEYLEVVTGLYELHLDCGDYYKTVMLSHYKSPMLELIEQVKAYDKKGMETFDIDFDDEDFSIAEFDDNHPLAKYAEDVAPWDGFYHLLPDQNNQTYASNLRIYEIKLGELL